MTLRVLDMLYLKLNTQAILATCQQSGEKMLSLGHFDLLILPIISISMASLSVSPSVPPCVCSGCGRFSYSSDSFSESNRCIKCSLFMALEVRLSS